MRMYPHIFAAVVVAAGLVPGAVSATEGGSAISRGREIVTAKCGRCHAVGAEGQSTHAKAPPFRDVVKRYPVENLAEALAEGIVSGHPDMPVFVFEPEEIDGILAYLNSLGAR